MKRFLIGGFLGVVILSASGTSRADDKKGEYPLKKCVVSDEDLGSMGKPYVIKHEGREVQLCCKSCEKDFKKDPKKFLKKLDDAEKKNGKK